MKKRIAFSANEVVTTGYPHTKEMKSDFTFITYKN